MRDVYNQYGIGHMNFVSEVVDHINWNGDKFVTALKRIYTDLGYASHTNDFRSNKSNWESYGSWIRFDQGEFVGIN